jgi:predicted DNA-binding protein YlxM (UPF0122 family)
MLYLSDLENAGEGGSLDTINMTSIFDFDKYDFKSEMMEMSDVLSPYLSLLSPLDKTLYDMYFIHNAKVEVLALYFEVSTTAIYKRIRTINNKLKSIVYLNMDKETLYNFLKTYFIQDTNTAKYIVQFIFQRTSKVGEDEDLNFKTIQYIMDRLSQAHNAGVNSLSEFVIKPIKRNNKRHYAYLKIKRLLEVINFIIDKKAYRYSIFRGSLVGTFDYRDYI